MKGKDTTIIVIALLGLVGLLAGAASLMPAINEERVALQLTANEQLMKNLPPEIAVTQAALGSFRGLAVDVLWARAEKMKQEGQFWEANQLAEMVTKLQPRFAQVWAFHAWNMAYNISVATHTPAERWKWVNDGVNLLRDEGIPLNPNSVLLYKELSWIFLHKIGMFSDDMHWYYKLQLAMRWQMILGEPVAGDTEQVIDQFRPIAEMFEQYVNRRELDAAVRDEFSKLADHPDLGDKIWPLRDLTIQLFDIRLKRLREEIAADDPDLAKMLAPLRKAVDAQRQREVGQPLERLIADDPAVGEQVAKLREMGFSLDEPLLARIGFVHTQTTSNDLKLMGAKAIDEHPETTSKLEAWLSDASIAEPREKIIAFTRAKVLTDQYHMDPMWMLELMEGAWFVKRGEDPTPIPLDWRHPASHGLYWAALGVRKSKGLLRPGDYDLLNTDRQVLHALQALTHTGKLIFDPVAPYYAQQPDVRYINAYDRAVYGATERIFSERLQHSAAPESFEAGHENFLIWAIQQLYFAGRDQMAEEYYTKLRKKYSQRQADRMALYSKPLREFVLLTFIRDDAITSLDEARGAIQGMLGQWIDEGLVAGQAQRAARLYDEAEFAHGIYMKKQDYKTQGAEEIGRNRMALPPFEQMVSDVLSSYLLAPVSGQRAALLKARAWNNAPIPFKQRIFDRIKDRLYDQIRKSGLNPAIAIPEPPGMEAYRKTHAKPQPAEQGDQLDGTQSRPTNRK
ncbi:hypothetical protein HED60_11010 [Planctomycetales bacterium ZRK34]|nr:hypothetical protein HED60_11010 [Planctomycetales bacterium ZRK34]